MAAIKNRAPLELFRNVKDEFQNGGLREEDIIIGVVDTGIDLRSRSFEGDDFPQPPSKWTDIDEFCSNKVLCATVAFGDNPSDGSGHGTECAAIAAGNIVDVECIGFKCTSYGILPKARLASYKISDDKPGDDIGGMRQMYVGSQKHSARMINRACSNGTDILSFSVSDPVDEENERKRKRTLPDAHDQYSGRINFLTYFATIHPGNILCCAAAGNITRVGKQRRILNTGTVKNLAPWVLTVGSSTSSTQFVTKVILQDSNGGALQEIKGYNLNTHVTNGFSPLIAHKDVLIRQAGSSNKYKMVVNKKKAMGKIIVCEGPLLSSKKDDLISSGAQGIIVKLDYIKDDSIDLMIPTAIITAQNTKDLESYMKINKGATARILCSSVEKSLHYPCVARKSGRGPSRISNYILKPDICAPGINVLTAVLEDRYNIVTGTSMATAIASSIAASVKLKYPDWSPAAIKSAIMTTADDMKNPYLNELEYLGMGAGLINPLKAMDPGLVYDMDKKHWNDWDSHKEDWNLNLPSFKATLKANQSFTFKRELTNVTGMPRCTFTSEFKSMTGKLKVSVCPKKLEFTKKDNKVPFELTVCVEKWSGDKRGVVAYTLVWKRKVKKFEVGHTVKSPIVITDFGEK